MQKHGFSLAEALITLLIISITTAALAPTITTRRNAALNPNLYWSAASGGVIASGSQNGVKFGIGAVPTNESYELTVGKGTMTNALNISGNTLTTGNFTINNGGDKIILDKDGKITGVTLTDGAVTMTDGAISKATTIEATDNITSEKTVQGATVNSTGDITAKGNISADGSINQLSGGIFLTTSACPLTAWTRSGSPIKVCTAANSSGCSAYLELYTCTYDIKK